MSCPGHQKTSWPELVGTPGEMATQIIESENKDVNATIVDEGGFFTTDFQCTRVRVFVNEKNLVSRVPQVKRRVRNQELRGIPGQVAALIIGGQNKEVNNGTTVEEGSFVTTDFQCTRIRVFVDDKNLVSRVPSVG